MYEIFIKKIFFEKKRTKNVVFNTQFTRCKILLYKKSNNINYMINKY